ncbi:cytochrome c-type biogenesis protein CcmE [Thiosulfatimonas sediminis]|uniref:Cytochrome c-type biogenesis protein CcmE n=1 Tax=Thiosulfatimonas sediminis TaxID=2675054 RepID=A0A6F8PX00_9GAMM|nr:cytochrome c maturation protein CcmE [Thiosulfatimonas sediminis]BBP46682.1 cytochrome c-type biogenesis protein CcmE [Thiosulfatimonas sediminis]
MSPLRKKRMYLVMLLLTAVSVATFLIIQAFNQNMMFFYSTSEVKSGAAPNDRDFRIGGLVVNGTVKRADDSLLVSFDLTDSQTPVTVQYVGILPDLFREGQGIIAKGQLNRDGIFVADEVLAKHDENYMPPEVADSIKKAQMAQNATPADAAKTN